jgi:hypothetical protein
MVILLDYVLNMIVSTYIIPRSRPLRRRVFALCLVSLEVTTLLQAAMHLCSSWILCGLPSPGQERLLGSAAYSQEDLAGRRGLGADQHYWDLLRNHRTYHCWKVSQVPRHYSLLLFLLQ